jgi:hypothetical protein
LNKVKEIYAPVVELRQGLIFSDKSMAGGNAGAIRGLSVIVK